MGGKASKTTTTKHAAREREVGHYHARLPHGGTGREPAPAVTSATSASSVRVSATARARASRHGKTRQQNQDISASGRSQTAQERGDRGRGVSTASTNPRNVTSTSTRPWTPVSPHSTAFTVSTADSVQTNAPRRDEHSSSSSSLEENDFVDPAVPNSSRMNDQYAYGGGNGHGHGTRSHQQQQLPDDQQRIVEAEKILGEIAKEYAAKRAAGLVPTKPIPARTLLWEELAKKSTQAGRRGQCVFGRDTDNICGCSTYKKKRVPGQENTGGVCECCNHGAAWHRLVGGSMARSSRMSRSIIGSSRSSQLHSGSYVPSEARSSAYDYDSDDDDDDDDDEAIANEMAVPSGFHPVQPMPPPPPQLQSQTSQGGMDRLSLLSMGSSYGFPSRLSSATNSLGALLQAIQRYRDMGLDEDEIENRIRADFPPVPRKSSVAARSDVSQSHVDV